MHKGVIMRTLKHPWDWVGHFIWFGAMSYFMHPLWAVIVCAASLEIDQYWTWHDRGWDAKDTCIDLICNGAGIQAGLWLRLLLQT